MKNNFEKTVDLTFPSNMPVLIFTPNKDNLKEDGKSKLSFYQTQLNNSSSKIITLEGHHYLHWTSYKEMSEQINEFIAGN